MSIEKMANRIKSKTALISISIFPLTYFSTFFISNLNNIYFK